MLAGWPKATRHIGMRDAVDPESNPVGIGEVSIVEDNTAAAQPLL